mgnify:CR=1 FL=1
MPSETLNIGFRRHLFTVELSPSGGEVFQSMMDGTDMYNYSLNPHVVGADGSGILGCPVLIPMWWGGFSEAKVAVDARKQTS